MEYISLHRFIRNTPSDTEDLAEQQLRAGGGPDHWKRIYRTMQNGATAREINFSDYRLHYKATIIKTVHYWYKNRGKKSKEQDRKPRNKPMHLWS